MYLPFSHQVWTPFLHLYPSNYRGKGWDQSSLAVCERSLSPWTSASLRAQEFNPPITASPNLFFFSRSPRKYEKLLEKPKDVQTDWPPPSSQKVLASLIYTKEAMTSGPSFPQHQPLSCMGPQRRSLRWSRVLKKKMRHIQWEHAKKKTGLCRKPTVLISSHGCTIIRGKPLYLSGSAPYKDEP